jgi:hypothetical protein
MVRVYCDSGAYVSGLNDLEQSGRVSVHQFKYENRSRRIKSGAVPSDLRYGDFLHYTYDELKTTPVLKDLTYDQLGGVNSKFELIVQLVGKHNRADAQHLDSAQMTGCTVFLTSDKGDIWSKKQPLLELLGLHVFHVPSEWDQFLEHIGG